MAEPRVVEVGQWQGSGSVNARRLVAGAAELAGLLPPESRLRAEVDPSATGPDVLVRNLHAARIAQARARGRAVLTAGGDCGVEIAPIEAALSAHGDRLAVVWFDAHGDLHTPATSASHAFHGMVLRTLLGDGPPGLTPLRTLGPGQVVLAGVRALDPAEREFVDKHGIVRADLGRVVDAVAATGAEAVYLHVDLDVLDPGEFGSVGAPEPDGIDPEALVAAVEALAARFTVAGIGLTEYEPTGAEGDQAVVARLVGAMIPLLGRRGPGAVDAAALERVAAAAWPAGQAEELGGWLVRRTPGVSRRRSNSALPGSVAGLDAVEDFYRSRRMPVIVQVGPAEQHTLLDAELARRGYSREAPTLVLTAPAAEVAAFTERIEIADRATAEWMAVHQSPEVAEVLGRVKSPVAFARIGAQAIGMFAAQGTWAGVFCMKTAEPHRRRGLARAVLGAGARWALTVGVTDLYLQVEQDNVAARELYRRAGFTYSHSYHYRRQSLTVTE